MPVLDVVRLNAGYGQVQTLWDVSLSVESGSVASLIGSNGAGKSTLLKAIMGLIPLSSGEITFDGVRIDGSATAEIVDLGIAYVPEGRHIFPDLSVVENLKMGSYPRRARTYHQDEMTRVFEVFPILKERAKQRAGTLSGGEAQMLATGRGLMSRPKFLMLDEPSAGLAPIMVEKIFQAISRISSLGITVLIVEQDVMRALSNSSKTYVLEHGRVTKSGTKEELLQDESVRKAYLGI
jgi:branched-chain amino acid transport system ATP-binding protein